MRLIRRTTNISSLMVVCLLALLLFSCASRPEHGISVTPGDINLGVVYTDSAVRKYTVEISNTGKQDLKITRVLPNCDCTTVSYSDRPLSSGSSCDLNITVDLHNFFPQKVEKKVAIYSNATEQPVFVTMKGEVKRR